MNNGVFYTVATPIGNLSDITQRALNVLNSVDIIICEDTRTSQVLLNKYELSSKLLSYHKFNEQQRTAQIIEELFSGKNIALITDAGTPCVSDPGCILIKELYANNIKVVPVPGACAVATLLSAVPREEEAFSFIGFLPRKNEEQKKIFEKYFTENLIFYESPKRLQKTLENIANFFGKEKKLAIGRELTKKFENIQVNTVEYFLQLYKNTAPKGELALLLYPELHNFADKKELVLKIKKLKEKNFSNKDISIVLSTLFEYNKNDVYEICMNSDN